MRNTLNKIVAFLFTFGSTLALAAMEEGAQVEPAPTVDVVWVYFFVIVFFGICAWFGVQIWSAEKKSRASASPSVESQQ